MKKNFISFFFIILSHTIMNASGKQELLDPAFLTCRQALVDHVSSLNICIKNLDEGITLYRNVIDSLPKNTDGSLVNPQDLEKHKQTTDVLMDTFDERNRLVDKMLEYGHKLGAFEDLLLEQTVKALLLKAFLEPSAAQISPEQTHIFKMLVKLNTPPAT